MNGYTFQITTYTMRNMQSTGTHYCPGVWTEDSKSQPEVKRQMIAQPWYTGCCKETYFIMYLALSTVCALTLTNRGWLE